MRNCISFGAGRAMTNGGTQWQEAVMDGRQIIDDRLSADFVTFSVERRRRLLDHDHPKRISPGVLNHQLESFNATCVGFVIKPNHVHALIWFPAVRQLSRFIHGWKRMSSFEIRKWYRAEAPDYCQAFGEGNRLWQPKYYAFEISSETKQEEKLHYLHLNPVRAGLVNQATDWKWSSAGLYECQRTVGVPIRWIR